MKKTLLFALVAMMVPSLSYAEYCTGQTTGTGSEGGRYTSRLNVTDGTNSVQVEGRSTPNGGGYQDRTSTVLETEPGKTITVTTTGGGGEWMHAMMYVDWNKNEVFDVDLTTTTTGVTKNPGNELLWWHYISINGTGYTTAGNVSDESENQRHFCPYNGATLTFVVPENIGSGDYRARFKIDWASTDPCGTTTDFKTRCGQMIDFTLRIAQTQIFTVNVPAYNAFANATTTVIVNGQAQTPGAHEFEQGSMISINVQPDAGYVVTSLTADGTAIANNTPFALTGNINTIAATVVEEATLPHYVLTYANPANGTLVVTKDGVAVESGASLVEGSALQLVATPLSHYELTSVRINGTEVLTAPTMEAFTHNFTMTAATTVAATVAWHETSYPTPTGTTHSDGTAFVKRVSTTGASADFEKNWTSLPGLYTLVDEEIAATDGTSFTLKLEANDLGSRGEVRQDLRYNYCMIFEDWDDNGEFEKVTRYGKNSGETGFAGNVIANYDEVMTINHQVTVPAGAAAGRIRVMYHNAWQDVPTSANFVVNEGQVLDFQVVCSASPRTITLEAGEGGTARFQGEAETVTVKENVEGPVVVMATPAEGYHFLNWTVDGTEVSTNATYTTSGSRDITLKANFGFQLTTSVGATGGSATITVNGAAAESGKVYAIGAQVQVVVTPNTGKQGRVTVNGNLMSLVSNTATFELTEDATVTVAFVDPSFELSLKVIGKGSVIIAENIDDNNEPTGERYGNGDSLPTWPVAFFYPAEGEEIVSVVVNSVDEFEGDDWEWITSRVGILWMNVTGPVNMSVTFSDNQSGIDNVIADGANGAVEYFNVQGVRVNENNMAPGLYIRRQGDKAVKVLVK